MEEKKRGRPAGKKLSADFYKKSAPQREDLALIAQGKIKLGADMDTPVKPEYDSKKDKPEYDSRKEKPEQNGAGGTPELTAQQAEALSKVCQTDELLDMMLRSLEQSGANPRWLDEAKISFSVGMMEVCRAILKPQGI
uniref:hypothetical protein n=1 Tax=Candidatus Scatocola faecipullorum TaxID=2840917 RepID=UPI0040286F8D